MRATFAIAATAILAGTTAASDIHHRHAHDLFHANDLEKRGSKKSNGTDDEGVCKEGCTTYYTTYYGEPTLYSPPQPTTAPPPVVPTPYPQDAPYPGTYTVPEHVVTVTQTTTVTYTTKGNTVTTSYYPGTYTQRPVTTTITESSTSFDCTFEIPTSKPTPTSTSSAAPSIAAYPTKGSSDGKPWGMTYTPYDTNGNCASAEQIDSDIKDIAGAGISVVRTYSTDCNALEYIGPAVRKYGIKMLVGIYIKDTNCYADYPYVAEQINAIKAWAQWDLVPLMVVGNEAIFNGFCTAGQLAALIHATKAALSYPGPYTTAETINVWQQPEVPAALCECVDWTCANIHPYFDRSGTSASAGTFVANQLNFLKGVCGGKPSKVLETGWPHSGYCLGSSCASPEDQQIAVKAILQTVGSDSIFLSYRDDKWKPVTPECGDCEQSWGCKAALGF